MSREMPSDETAPVVANKVKPVSAGRVGERQHIAREFPDRIGAHVVGPGLWRVATLVEGERAEPAAQRARHAVPTSRSRREPVQQHHAVGVARTVVDHIERPARMADLAQRHRPPPSSSVGRHGWRRCHRTCLPRPRPTESRVGKPDAKPAQTHCDHDLVRRNGDREDLASSSLQPSVTTFRVNCYRGGRGRDLCNPGVAGLPCASGYRSSRPVQACWRDAVARCRHTGVQGHVGLALGDAH